VRELASELATSRNTVEGAYQELYAEGYLYSQPRSGYFVSALDAGPAPLARAGQEGRVAPRPSPPASWAYDFHPARLDPESFPLALWRKCFIDSLRGSARELSHYGDPQGEWELRAALQSYLERSRGVICAPEQIIICAGLQQSLDIVARLLKGDHAVLAIENPGYPLPRAVFSNHAYQVVPIPAGPAGLELGFLKASQSTVAYVTPSHQLPLGYVMPVAQRLTLIEWAEAGGRMIIEDDYDSELRYHGKPIPALQGLRPHGNIIYSGTFSKVLSPALRVSYLVLPPSLLASYHNIFRNYFTTVPLLEQRTLSKFMAAGHWERHIRRMRTLYKKKHDILLRAIGQHFASRGVVVGQGAGLHVVLQLAATSRSEAEIIECARKQDIQLLPMTDFYNPGTPEATMLLLGFGGLSAKEIEEGIALLARICI
jgi:GntR family transcriptional regulator/MocR family aminotransferase